MYIDTPITLYSHRSHHLSHRIRLALAYKKLKVNIITVRDELPEDVIDLNPYNTLPTLIERDLVLYQADAIINYLEERYKGVKLLPDTPAERAKVRQLVWRIEKDWLRLADILLTHPDSMSADAQAKARHELTDSLVTLSPLFAHQPFFMSDTFGLCDCVLAPIFYRLDEMSIELPAQPSKALLSYIKRLFALESFEASLSC